jgi:DNA-binding NarL/FixJ family response regulator
MPIRILLAQLPHALQDPLERILSEQPDMVVTAVESHVEVLLAAGEAQADVVVIGMRDRQPPGVVSHLLSEYPSQMIIVVDVDDLHGFVYELRPYLAPIGEVLSAKFPNAIRAAVRERDGA